MNNILYNPQEIEECVFEIAERLNEEYNPENDHNVVFVPILQGVIPFFANLAKAITFDPYVEYMGIESYQGTQQKELRVYRMFDSSIVKNKIIWVFDDIADSGNTLHFATKMLKQAGAKEVYTCSLLKRDSCTYPVDLYGFLLRKRWVFGYGMDAPNGRGRTLNSIFVAESAENVV